MQDQERDSAKAGSLAVPFAIPGHEWRPNETGIEPDELVLVRKHKPDVHTKAGQAAKRLASKTAGTSEFIAKNFGDGTRTLKVARAQDSFRDLLACAEAGDDDALFVLANMMTHACELLTQLAKTSPKRLRPMTRNKLRWPVMQSLHPNLSEDARKLLRQLQLGEDTGLEVDPSAKWINDEFSRIARRLQEYLQHHREKCLKHCHENQPEPPRVHPAIELTTLPEFDSDSAPDWWKAAEAVFLLAYPVPQHVPELNVLIQAAGDRKIPSRIKPRIMENLKRRFISLAPPPKPYRT